MYVHCIICFAQAQVVNEILIMPIGHKPVLSLISCLVLTPQDEIMDLNRFYFTVFCQLKK